MSYTKVWNLFIFSVCALCMFFLAFWLLSMLIFAWLNICLNLNIFFIFTANFIINLEKVEIFYWTTSETISSTRGLDLLFNLKDMKFSCSFSLCAESMSAKKISFLIAWGKFKLMKKVLKILDISLYYMIIL